MAILPGKRVRDNSIFGTLSGAMSSGTVSMASANLADLSTIAGDHAIITLDPFRQFGDPEIVMVTSHPVGGTTATVQRGMYFTVARNHGIGTQWAHAATVEDFADVLTSGTLPVDSYEGQMVYQTDTDSYVYWDGSAWVNLAGSGSPVTLGYAENTALAQAVTSITPLTGLSVNVTVPAGRRIKITGLSLAACNTVDSRSRLSIMEGATMINADHLNHSEANVNETLFVSTTLTPTAGTHTYNLSGTALDAGTSTFGSAVTLPAYILVEDITGDPLPYNPVSVPVGLLGYAEAIADQAGIATNALVTGLSVNVSVPAGRSLRINTYFDVFSSVDGAVPLVEILQDGVVLERSTLELGDATSRSFTMLGSIIESPPAGSHTYTVRLTNALGVGTLTMTAAANRPAFISVEDITMTPSTTESAPSSTLAYSEATANQGTFTAETDLTNLSVTVTVPAGRRLKITGCGALESSVAADEITGNIKEGATNLGRWFQETMSTANRGHKNQASAIVTPTAGSHTYKLTALRQTGTGNITLTASVGVPAFILVEDITGASIPAFVPPNYSVLNQHLILAGGTTSGTTALVLGTMAIPAQSTNFVVEFDYTVVWNQTVTTDIFEMIVGNNLDAQARHSRDTHLQLTSHSYSGHFAFAAGSSPTLTFSIFRQAGTGTASPVADGRFTYADVRIIPQTATF